ncbi:hypothetical protein GA0070616_0726 [Micromonospora nigra]|uniref:Right handed beta helix region n=1 Tax=Micromonospora nigra TaxID=145857 RepID=A0A1C6RE44_9ACTN|nr:hypothetical protein [Micromonospora nigra]SCL15429.1 hypothetical protein GA0070616_0726 [Micromonospora nigra]
MSDDVTTSPPGEAAVGPPARGRRKLWMAAGVAGLTGVVGLAALGGVAARDDRSGGTQRVSDARASTPEQQVSDAGAAEGADARGGDDRADGQWGGDTDKDRSGKDHGRQGGGKDHNRQGGKGREVPCNSDKLIQAVVEANREHGDVLHLAKGCTYELTRSGEGGGLPVITRSITLKGHDSKIVRAAVSDYFRIFTVGRSGHLTLKNVTVMGGQTGPELVGPPVPPAAVDLFGSTTATTRAAKPATAGATPPAKPARAATGTANKTAKVAKPSKAAKPSKTAKANKPVKAAAVPPSGAAVAPLVEAGPSDGAGILVLRGGTADIEHSELVQNHAGGHGGAIANYGTTRVAHSLIERNSSAGVGGGIFNAGVLRVEESKVANNSARIGGGGIGNGVPANGTSVEGGTVWVWKSTISHNRTSGLGGGVLDDGGTTTLAQSQLTDNDAGQDVGGVVALNDSELTLEHVLVARNAADGDAGGVGVGEGSTVVATHTTIAENVAVTSSGGLFNVGGDVVLRDSAVVANQAVGLTAIGGGILNRSGTIRLVGTKVSYNFAPQAPGGIFTDNDGVSIDRTSAVTGNRPTNCVGSPVIPNRCFG